ncbi:MAG: hypothetical protein Q8L37_03140 [Candidatus Gottesmanbacteria bacterium]|nr:hypothetical protein [Candidatus Gottesmanbacteria bacterium]
MLSLNFYSPILLFHSFIPLFYYSFIPLFYYLIPSPANALSTSSKTLFISPSISLRATPSLIVSSMSLA